MTSYALSPSDLVDRRDSRRQPRDLPGVFDSLRSMISK
ncbi:hypothetical protein ES319_D05G374100v1 [Gossypium barbadense]|uniref:Uncharacterized protein n=1 Tax=Gossypium barbadense TaxID=3634 RepID=A0A5J5RML6_GOSBA|nr:hypothetical protein ES319_D05G374100v1 [Gossypium barbadense]